MDYRLYRLNPNAPPIEMIDGPPPEDQSALVTALRGENAILRDIISTLQQRAQARKDADAAQVDGQDDLNLISNVPPPTP